MSDFLHAMAESSRARLALARTQRSAVQLRRQIEALPAAPALELPPFAIIAEIKPRSPARGPLVPGGQLDVGAALRRAADYVRGGASILSVLTEPQQFGGSLELLGAVAAGQPACPVLRKDFLIDPYQLLEARAAGARGVLLIARLLAPPLLDEMLTAAGELGLFVLLEAFDEADIERIAAVRTRIPEPALLGVNTRDLVSLEIDGTRLPRLAPQLIVLGGIAVAESGLEVAADAEAAARLGYRAALVGEALMRSADPARLIAEMRAAGTAARANR